MLQECDSLFWLACTFISAGTLFKIYLSTFVLLPFLKMECSAGFGTSLSYEEGFKVTRLDTYCSCMPVEGFTTIMLRAGRF